jgi:hypothetical protein
MFDSPKNTMTSTKTITPNWTSSFVKTAKACLMALLLLSCQNPGTPRGSAGVAFSLTDISQVEKVTFSFTSGSDTVTSELAPSGQMVQFDDARLAGKTWQAAITVSAATSAFESDYTYQGALNFSGGVIQLPPPIDDSWSGTIHTEIPVPQLAASIEIVRSISPLHGYTVDVQLPSGITGGNASVDRGYWTEQGDPVADTQFGVFSSVDGRTFHMALPDPDSSIIDNSQLHWVDSFLSVSVAGTGTSGLVQQYFNWEVRPHQHIPSGPNAHPSP